MRLSTFLSLALAASTVSAALRPQCSKELTIRKEWRDTTDREKKAFLDAIKCLGNAPHESSLAPLGATPNMPPLNTSGSRYDDFVYAHMDLFVKDHYTALFLPWHRWFVHTFENKLKTKCNYKGSMIFWDWSRDAATLPSSPIFNSSSTYGLGGLGTSDHNYTVTDGAFSSAIRAYPSPHVMQRNFSLHPYLQFGDASPDFRPDLLVTELITPQAVAKVVGGSKGNYTDFAFHVDGAGQQGMHGAVHVMLGGDLLNLFWSPNDPLFYLHHGNLDCIWARWQKNDSRNALAYGGGLTQVLDNYKTYPVGAPPAANFSTHLPADGLADPVKVEDVMSTENDYLCYRCAY